MNETDQFAKLREPFPESDIEWKVGACGWSGSDPWVRALCYMTARAVMDRLDDVMGPENWKDDYELALGASKGILCRLSLRIDGEWVTKVDGAEETDVESFKGGLSNALKRAAVRFGIGRYLYNLESAFVPKENVSRTSRAGWSYAKPKKGTGNPFWWKPPSLEAWALPGGSGKPGGKAEKPKPKITATQSQVQRIKMLQKEMGIADGPYRKRLKEKHGVTSCKDLSIPQADEVIKSLETAKKKSFDEEAKATFGDGPSDNDDLRKLRKLALDYLKVVSELGDDAAAMMVSTNDLPSETVGGNRDWISQTDDRDRLERGVLALEFIINQHQMRAAGNH